MGHQMVMSLTCCLYVQAVSEKDPFQVSVDLICACIPVDLPLSQPSPCSAALQSVHSNLDFYLLTNSANFDSLCRL